VKAPLRTSARPALLRYAPALAAAALLLVLPLLAGSPLQSVVTKILIFAIFAMSLDILVGYVGLFPLGHAAFFGASGYVVGVLMVKYDISNFFVAAPIAVAAAALLAALFGLIALRVTGAYFLLVTFALGELITSVAWKWVSMTGGSDGLAGIGRPELGLPGFTWSAESFYYFVLAIFVISYALMRRVVRSPFGHTLTGIRESEVRMQCLGYNTWLHKYVAFVLAGAFAGVAGVLFAYHGGIMVPPHLGVLTSTLASLIVIMGGAGTLFGSLIGSAVIFLVEYYASTLTTERWPLILGACFIASVLWARGGIGVLLARLWARATK
jgi:branched-chain amino acid transport system permease protein